VKKRDFECITLGLTAEREMIYQRINARVDAMLEHGLLNEAKHLHQYKELPALKTVGYKEIFDYLEGKYAFDFAVAEIKKNTRRFAKRQITWNKKYMTAHWFDAQHFATQEIIELIEKSL